MAVVGSSLVAVSPAGTAVAADEVVELPPGEVVASAEELPGPVERVELADGVVVVQAGGQVLWRSRDDAGAEWSSTWGGLRLTGDLVDADGDAVLTQAGVDGPGTLTWASDGGGSREVPAGAELGRGGYYVLWPTGVVNQWRGESVTGGSGGVETSPAGVVAWENRVSATESQWLWDVCDAVDVDESALRLADRTERWILAACDGRAVVVDDARLPAVRVYQPISPGQTGFDPARLQVGEGVVVGFADGVLSIAPVLGGSPVTLPESVAFDLDDDGRTLAHVDAQGDLRIVDLEPVASKMLTTSGDTTHPSAPSLRFYADQRMIAGTSPTQTYEAIAGGAQDVNTDPLYAPSGLDHVDLRHGPSTTGPWTTASPNAATVTFPAGSQECWQARTVDRAGNVSAWTEARCVRVDGTAPVVSPRTPPSSTKASSSGSTSVTFTYSGKDDVALDSYDVRYRVTPKGRSTASWVYPSAHQHTTATSITVSATRSSTACFSVRARDRAGTTSAWSSTRCTYLDGTTPKVVRTSVSGPFLLPKPTGLQVWQPQFVATATDDRQVVAYQIQQRSNLSRSGISDFAWRTSRTVRSAVEPGGQTCLRGRAKDSVGNIGAWSGWRCAQAPITPNWDWDFDRTHLPLVNGTDVVAASKAYRPNPRTEDSFVARIVRVKVRTGPNEGRAQVYVGDRYLGTISGTSSTVGWKWVTVSASTPGSGRVSLRALTNAPTRITTLYAMRWWA